MTLCPICNVEHESTTLPGGVVAIACPKMEGRDGGSLFGGFALDLTPPPPPRSIVFDVTDEDAADALAVSLAILSPADIAPDPAAPFGSSYASVAARGPIRWFR